MSGSRSGSSRCPRIGAEDRAELLAHHYLEAIALSRSAALDVAELEPRAAEALRAAGLRAFAIGVLPSRRPCASRRLRMAPGGLDPYALRVLGKASMFTEQSGEDELRQAFDGFHAAGAKVEAAVAAIDLAMAFWQHGDGRRAGEWTAQSRALVDGAPASAAHAHVLAQVARLEMLSGRAEQSLATASRAIELAAASGAEAPRVSALVTRATRAATWATTATRTSRKRSRWRNDTISARSDGSTRTSAPCSSGAEISSGRRPSPVKGISITSARG